MLYQTLDICVNYEKANCARTAHQPKLDCYVPVVSCEPELHEKRPAVVVCPGGGYGMCSPREAEPIALAFASRGIPAFVLWYSVAPMRFPGALLEACEAVAEVRRHAKEWNIDPDRIAVCGFSAGGHLTGTVGTLWNQDFVCDTLGYHNEEHRPNALILSYAVLSAEPDALHGGSFQNLLGHDPEVEEQQLLSCEKQVGKHTPPAFIWHTYDDPVVPVRNSLWFADAMAKNEVPFELHVYPHGPHGLALGTEVTGYNISEPDVVEWVDRCAKWLKSL